MPDNLRRSGSKSILSPGQVYLDKVLTRFHEKSTRRAVIQLSNSLGFYVLLWFGLYWSWHISPALAVSLSLFAGFVVVRVFIIMHDCGHGSFTPSKLANDIIGNIAGLIVFTPYYHWRWEHAIHHTTSGNLARRGIGDLWTMTVREYLESPWWRRAAYATMRNPVVL